MVVGPLPQFQQRRRSSASAAAAASSTGAQAIVVPSGMMTTAQQHKSSFSSISSLRNIYWYIILPIMIVISIFTVIDFSMTKQQYFSNSYYRNAPTNLIDEPTTATTTDDSITMNQHQKHVRKKNDWLPPKYRQRLVPSNTPIEQLKSKVRFPLEGKIQSYEHIIKQRASQALNEKRLTESMLKIIKTPKLVQEKQNRKRVNHNLILPSPKFTNSTTIVIVLSASYQYSKRQAIRETWGKNHNNIYFVIGHSNCQDPGTGNSGIDGSTDLFEYQDPSITIANKKKSTVIPECRLQQHAFIFQEQLQYHDIIEVPMEEHYQGLPDKVIYSYMWILQHIPHVEFIIKTDDDMFARVTSLEQYVESRYNPYKPIIIGQIIPRSEVSKEGKWAEPNYNEEYYPYWAQGSAGYIVTRPIIEYIATNEISLYRYQGEDVSLGIW